MTPTPNPIPVGECLRQLRTQLGLSVRTLAAKAGFSPSFISQVEHAQVSPSIASLERIVAILGITLGGFFTESTRSPVVVVRGTARQELVSSWSQATLEALGPAGGTQVLEPLLLTLAPGGRSGPHLHAARGEQFALICEGEVTLTLPDHTYVLRPGDAVSLAAATPHQWQNLGPEPARVLLVSAYTGSSMSKPSS